jgi:hypothetical protein
MALTIAQGAQQLKQIAKQMNFALSQAINDSLDDSQSEVQRGLGSKYTLRRPTFVKRLVKRERTDFAKKDKLLGAVRITGTGAGGRAVGDLLAKFEEGGAKIIQGQHVALPLPGAKRNKYDIITAANRPRRLIQAGKAFILPQKDGSGEVVLVKNKRPLGGKARKNKALFALENARPKIPANLQFFKTTTYVTTRTFVANLQQRFAGAMRTAR